MQLTPKQYLAIQAHINILRKNIKEYLWIETWDLEKVGGDTEEKDFFYTLKDPVKKLGPSDELEKLAQQINEVEFLEEILTNKNRYSRKFKQ